MREIEGGWGREGGREREREGGDPDSPKKKRGKTYERNAKKHEREGETEERK